eukprot:CAMPEP_0172502198 /NCGR_PEP_ID=MMETSP1066-20121228/157712_1 /TAXON_ID=671091 /ORGANISM="Coscinodiscus wailesii, Strain CCMP2513" /LENGTH=177 /DNA_ID=CAMNT_0013277369 /DNA_START=27 /DNA_END=557 /DNA_ORIENTATION=-
MAETGTPLPPPASDEEMRKLLKPNPTVDQLTDVIKLNYTEPGSSTKVVIVKQLDSYDDVNYLVTLDDVKYLVKVHNGVESREYITSRRQNLHKSCIELSTAIIHHLHSHSIPVNVPYENYDIALANLPVLSAAHSPQRLAVRLLHWVPGVPLSSLSNASVEVVAEAGALLGRVCVAL